MPEMPGTSAEPQVGEVSYARVSDIPDIPGRVRDRLDRWRADVVRTRFEPVADALQKAAAGAERLAGRLGVDADDGEGADGAAVAAAGAGDTASDPGALLAPLADDVLEPIRETLEETDLCAGFPLSLLETLHELRSRATKLPETASIPEDESLYEASDDDSTLVGLRKALIRGSRRLPGGSQGPRRRNLPLRAIALRHVVERIGEEEIRTALEQRRRIALALARVERALSDLTHAVLAADDPSNPSSLAATALDAGERLLEAADSLGPPAAAPIAREEWEADVRTAGTFLGDNGTLGDEAIRRRLTRLTRHAEEWADWQNQLTDRLRFCVRLIGVRYELDAAGRSVRSNLADDLSRPAQALDSFAREIRRAESDVPSDALSSQTLEASAWLADTEMRLLDELERSIIEALPSERLTNDVQQALGALRDDAGRIRDRFGATFAIHALPPPDAESIDPRPDPTQVDLGEILRQGLQPLADEPFQARLDAAADSLVEVLRRAPELKDVIRYNLRAADSRSEDEPEDEVRPADVVQTGLARASEAADQMAAGIRERAAALDDVIAEALGAAWARIHERARIQRQMQGAVMDLQREVDVQFRRASETTRSAWRRLSTLTRRSTMRGAVLARRMLRRGREAVGAVTDERAGYHETAAALSSLDEMLGQVPPIYRRLFSFSPLTEPELLVGREQDLAFLKRHVALWEVGVPQALILHGSPSSGRTSLLNVLRNDLEESHDIIRIVLPHDLSTETDLIVLLDKSGIVDARGAETLFELGDRILELPRPQLAHVCIIENLGSLMTRTIGGFDLISEFISMMSRTDSRLLWIATMSESGWKALVAARPEAASLAISKTLEPIDRAGLERLVMQRHQRSGVPLEFLEPPEPSPLLRRRLRTALGTEHRQRILREAWFDRLFSVTGQDIMMALFYWVRSVEMTEAEDRLLVRWFTPIRFDFLSAFSMDQAFALKAILERGTLTVAQHADTNLVSTVESRRILESLGNAMLIEPIGEAASPTRFDFTSIRDDAAYRIRPLVIHPVIRFLRERNIVH